MENFKMPFEYSYNLQWTASKEDFVEFVWMLLCLRSWPNGEKKFEDDEPEFNRQADLLGENFLSVFKPDISPYKTFFELRINTSPSFEFTYLTTRQMALMQDNDSFFSLLMELGVLPSYETLSREILKWKKAEQLTCLLFSYMRID